MRESLRLVGGAALVRLGVAAAAAMALSLLEPAIAVLFQLVLVRAGLLVGAGVPAWLQDIARSSMGIAIAVAIAATVRAAAQLVSSQSAASAKVQIEARLRNAAARVVLADETLTPLTDVQTHVSETFPRAAGLWQQGVSAMTLALQGVALAIALVWLSPLRAAVAISALAVVGAMVRVLGWRVQRVAGELPARQRAVVAGFERIARHRGLVRVLGTAPDEHAAIERDVAAYSETMNRAYMMMNASGALGPLLGMVVVIGVLAAGPEAGAPGAKMVAFLYLFVRLSQVVGMLANAATHTAALLPHWREAVKWTAHHAHAATIPTPPTLAAHGETPASPPPRIVIDGVHFAYPGGPPVLAGVSLAVDGGALVGLSGPSGCGKTTLLHAVVGLLAPSRGRVTLDDSSPADYLARRGARVGYVSAEALVFAGTLRENLLYGCRWAPSDAEIGEVVALAHADDLMGDAGLGRIVGEGGIGLSAGQKQRLALARALLRRPDLLVLDEPTANVDEATEARLVDTLVHLRGRVTCLVVSHRRALLARCDSVLAFEATGLATKRVFRVRDAVDEAADRASA